MERLSITEARSLDHPDAPLLNHIRWQLAAHPRFMEVVCSRATLERIGKEIVATVGRGGSPEEVLRRAGVDVAVILDDQMTGEGLAFHDPEQSAAWHTERDPEHEEGQ